MLNFLTPQEILTEVAGCLQDRLLPVVSDPVSRRQLRAAIFLTGAVAEALPRLHTSEQSSREPDANGPSVSSHEARVMAIGVLDRWIELQPLDPALGDFEPLGIDVHHSRTDHEGVPQP